MDATFSQNSRWIILMLLDLELILPARDIQQKCKEKGHPWEIAKAFDQSAVVGHFRSVEEFEDLSNIPFSLKKNDQYVQKGNTGDMIFDFRHLISYISSIFTLHISDYIFTGTPAGVGPIAIGDRLEGFLGQELFFHVNIK